MNQTILSEVDVMYVQAEGLEKVKEAFSKLEAKLASLKGRKFYGAYTPQNGIYKACVAITKGDDPAALGLETYTIPGGKYAGEKLNDWEQHIPEIGQTFMKMTETCNYDDTRPSIEYYRSMKEMVCYLPVK